MTEIAVTDHRRLGKQAAYGLLVLVVILWGFNWPALKVGLRYVSPMWFAVYRMAIATLALFGLLVLRRQVALPNRANIPVVLSIGVCQLFLLVGLINLGMMYVPAGRSSVLSYTSPIWVAPAAVWLLGEKLTPLKATGVALGLVGIGVLFNPLAFDWHNSEALAGNIMLMAGALAWSVAIIHIRHHKLTQPVLQIMPWSAALATLLLTVAAVSWEGAPKAVSDPTGLAIVIYNGLIATAFCFTAMTEISRALPAISTSLGMLGVPVAGVASSIWWLGENLTPTLALGMALILAGMILVNLSGSPRASAR